MTTVPPTIHAHLRELERNFEAFSRGNRGRLFDSRDALVKLCEAVEIAGFDQLIPLCEITSRLLGMLLRDGTLDEHGGVSIARELLAHIESSISIGQTIDGKPDDEPGGVFRVNHKTPIGEVLLRLGKIDSQQLDQALVLQKVRKGRKVGEILLAMNLIDDKSLSEALTHQARESKHVTESSNPSVGASGLRLAQIPDLPPIPGPGSIPPPPGESAADLLEPGGFFDETP